jgi:nitrogen fixation/metabolism regulation signal transduction histidine kinase
MARQVAHDIKNPLTPIQLSAELLQRAKRERHPDFDALFDRTIELVLRQVEHLRETASDFHALTGVQQAKLERVEIGPLVGDVLELESAWARALGVKIERSGEGGAVRADPALLRRVLINLVSNALEAMPQGGVLSVRTASKDSEVEIEIEDSGIGIPDDVRPRLFEPYFTTRSTGTGLGLAIAKRVVESLGGSISLGSAPGGNGTLARVRLPRDPGA